LLVASCWLLEWDYFLPFPKDWDRKKGESGEGQFGNFTVGHSSVFNFDLKNEQKRPQIDRNLTAVSPQLSRNYPAIIS